jgi:hypothetical protein
MPRRVDLAEPVPEVVIRREAFIGSWLPAHASVSIKQPPLDVLPLAGRQLAVAVVALARRPLESWV